MSEERAIIRVQEPGFWERRGELVSATVEVSAAQLWDETPEFGAAQSDLALETEDGDRTAVQVWTLPSREGEGRRLQVLFPADVPVNGEQTYRLVRLERAQDCAVYEHPLPDWSSCASLEGTSWTSAHLPRLMRSRDIVAAVDSPEDHVAFPGICRAPNGALIVVYRAGLTHAAQDNPRDGRIMLVRSHDLGQTWSEPELVVDSPDYDDRNPAIACLSDGTLVLCWDKYLQAAHHGAFLITSEDLGRTWSDPVQLGQILNVHTRSRALELSEEEILVPLSCSDGGPEELAAYAIIVNRRTGEQLTSVLTPIGDRNIADEVAVARAADGRLVALIRSNSDPVLWQTNSFDEGRTWCRPFRTSIPSQFTPADLITLDDGRLLCAFSFRERRNERLLVSRDCGETWDIESSVDVLSGTRAIGGDRSYPATVQLDEETLGTVLYETRPHPHGGRIYFVRTLLADLDRKPFPCLYQSDPEAEGATFEAPLRCPELGLGVHVTYRFTGKFGAPPNAFEVALAAGPREVRLRYQMGTSPDRSRPTNVVRATATTSGDVQVLAEGEAQGDWFDDGNLHTICLELGEGTVRGLLDGHEQFSAPAERFRPDLLRLTTDRACVAVQSIRLLSPGRRVYPEPLDVTVLRAGD